MSDFSKVFKEKCDLIIAKQQEIFDLGKTSARFITFYINDEYGEWHPFNALEGMTFRKYMKSNLKSDDLSLDGNRITFWNYFVTCDLDDVIVEEGVYEVNFLTLNGEKYYCAGSLVDWVKTEENTGGYYFDNYGYMRDAEGNYIVAESVYDACSLYIISTHYSPYASLQEYCYSHSGDIIFLNEIPIPLPEGWSKWTDAASWNINQNQFAFEIQDDSYVYVEGIVDWEYGQFMLSYNGALVRGGDDIVAGGRYIFVSPSE